VIEAHQPQHNISLSGMWFKQKRIKKCISMNKNNFYEEKKKAEIRSEGKE
jgi:hypothetical protein